MNTVLRMEPLNKEFGTSIILSEKTFSEVRGDVRVTELPCRKLRGKSEEIRLYSLEEALTPG